MNLNRLDDLIAKRKNNSISNKEEKELDTLLITDWILDKKPKEVNWDNLYYNRILKKHKKNYYRQVIAIAAILLTILSISLLIKKNISEVNTELENTNLTLSEIKGAKDLAILSISNGNEIQLDNKNYKEIIDDLKDTEKTEIYTITTPKASKYQLILPDGTKVWLNANSQITFPSKFDSQYRKIETTGEVYLEVVKSNVPFIIQTNGVKTEVLGTSLNINSYNPNKTITTLLTGKVNISNSFRDQILTPGQAAEISANYIKTFQPNLEKIISWKNNKFYFENENINDILTELERWYDINFIINSDKLQNKTYSGVIDRTMTLQQTLDILNFGTSYQMKLTNKTITVTNKN